MNNHGFVEGEYIIYVNGERYEIGRIKSIHIVKIILVI